MLFNFLSYRWGDTKEIYKWYYPERCKGHYPHKLDFLCESFGVERVFAKPGTTQHGAFPDAHSLARCVEEMVAQAPRDNHLSYFDRVVKVFDTNISNVQSGINMRSAMETASSSKSKK